MPYCPRCGIEVDYDTAECPLCSFPIPLVPHEPDIKKEEIQLKNYYEELRQLKKKRKKRFKNGAFVIIILTVIFTGFNNAMQDFYTHNMLTFSPYVLSSLGLFIGVLICVFGYIKDLRKIFALLFILTIAFLFSIDFYSGGPDWFLPVGLPITLLSFGIILLTSIIIKRNKRGGLFSSGIILSAAAAFIIILEIIIDAYTGTISLTWSIQVFISTFSLSLLFLLARKIFQKSTFKRLKRFFHF